MFADNTPYRPLTHPRLMMAMRLEVFFPRCCHERSQSLLASLLTRLQAFDAFGASASFVTSEVHTSPSTAISTGTVTSLDNGKVSKSIDT
jgi:hypothetical protein